MCVQAFYIIQHKGLRNVTTVPFTTNLIHIVRFISKG